MWQSERWLPRAPGLGRGLPLFVEGAGHRPRRPGRDRQRAPWATVSEQPEKSLWRAGQVPSWFGVLTLLLENRRMSRKRRGFPRCFDLGREWAKGAKRWVKPPAQSFPCEKYIVVDDPGH